MGAVRASTFLVQPCGLPSSLEKCLETPLGVTTKLHDRNASILTKDEQTFEKHADKHPEILTRVFEGERAVTQNRNLLEKFH